MECLNKHKVYGSHDQFSFSQLIRVDELMTTKSILKKVLQFIM